ncbi:tripartite tricarboxylate transporter substrate binding protein [Aeromicrobium duanguangcaii]|uniref:Tripartite tricarboxylate transporter substrate binding protein n=1 Tax=Aeromicrobium duanguangcaii TaxID=2968086 RepID=A0ABY5KKS3_9ACTN|nr:tripartite tricarboxylate transporter substrate binding protein [Aeromicrobium duanguangcaii]MCD9153142.1 tripartite tricarboxylate transporter substrate binding protein [Aeromicrobium duanguangcaii]UUI69757.1 tripartite tricarboxylate transporter substrate binding protein [Aeromicrobium duanguangcaii]
MNTTPQRRLRSRLPFAGCMVAVASLSLSGCVSSDSDGASDPDFPTKSITLTIPYAPGGGTDTAGRLVAKALEAELGQSIVVVNKDGGGGSIGVSAVASAKADGYNLGMATDSNVVLQPILNKDLQYDKADFKSWNLAPSTFVLVASSGSDYTTLADVIAQAKKNPGKVRIAHPGTGGSNDLTARAFALAADIDIVPVPITGGGAEINKAVASGQVELAMTTVPVAKGFVDSGDLVVAGTMGDEPAAGAEESETLGSIGVDTDLIPQAALVMLAPAGVSDEVADSITEALQVQADGDLGDQMTRIGFPMAFGDPESSGEAMNLVQKQYEEILDKFDAGQ